MADRLTASASRVGRPRMRSAHQTPCVPKIGGPGQSQYINLR